MIYDKYSEWQYWMLQNVQLLSSRYGTDGVVLDGQTWHAILIFYYGLPRSWKQRTTRLLIVMPAGSQIFHTPPNRFYIDRGLRTVTGQKPSHYFEDHHFNDMANQDVARFSFHLIEGWNPKVQCNQGTTLLDVIDALYLAMDMAAKEVMR